MGEFEQYLVHLRAALDVDDPRADEIIAEARGHLQAQAQELEEGGMSREEAVAEAVRIFGEPESVAEQLRRANGRFRAFSLGRLLLSMAVAFALISATDAVSDHLVDLSRLGLNLTLPEPREAPALSEAAKIGIVFLAFFLPAAILAGRRHWWIPSALMSVYLLGMCTQDMLAPVVLAHLEAHSWMPWYVFVWPVAMLAAVTGFTYGGARLSEFRLARYPLAAIALAYAIYLAPRVWQTITVIAGGAHLFAALTFLPTVFLLLLAFARRRSWPRLRLAAPAAIGAFAFFAGLGAVCSVGTAIADPAAILRLDLADLIEPAIMVAVSGAGLAIALSLLRAQRGDTTDTSAGGEAAAHRE